MLNPLRYPGLNQETYMSVYSIGISLKALKTP